MSKAEFFQELHARLRCLPAQEQQRIVGVYEDLFRQAEANGKSEQEIIASLGRSPSDIWSGFGSDCFRQAAESGFRILMASLALALFNLIFVLGPAIALAALLLVLSLASILLLLSPVWIFWDGSLPAVQNPLLLKLFLSMAGAGLGLLLASVMWLTHRACYRFVKAYFRMNMRLIKGE